MRRRRQVLAASAAGLTAALCLSSGGGTGTAPDPQEGRLRGEVRTAARRPVAAATIVAVRDEGPAVLALTATDTDGFVVLDHLPGGRYTVTARAPGFERAVISDVVVSGPFRSVVDFVMVTGNPAGEELHVAMGSGPATIAIRVVDDSGAPLSGVRVSLEPVGQRHDPIHTETDTAGEASIEDPLEGSWKLTLERTGWTRLGLARVHFAGGEVRLLARLLPLTEVPWLAAIDLIPPARFRAPRPPQVDASAPVAFDDATSAPDD